MTVALCALPYRRQLLMRVSFMLRSAFSGSSSMLVPTVSLLPPIVRTMLVYFPNPAEPEPPTMVDAFARCHNRVSARPGEYSCHSLI
jgi:hypothetical protein